MKRIISILLAVMLIMSVAVMTGCNKKTEKKADTNTASGASSTTGSVKVPEGAVADATTAEGNATGYTKFDKDEKGRVIRTYSYDSLGRAQGSIGYEHDDKDMVTKEIHYDNDGKITLQIAFEYNENGFEVKRTVMDAQGKVKYSIVTEFSEDGTAIHTKYDADGKEIK